MSKAKSIQETAEEILDKQQSLCAYLKTYPQWMKEDILKAMEEYASQFQSPIVLPKENEYGNGLFNANKFVIDFCKNEIERIKSDGTKPNTSRQITNGGKIYAYNKILQRLTIKNKKSQLKP